MKKYLIVLGLISVIQTVGMAQPSPLPVAVTPIVIASSACATSNSAAVVTLSTPVATGVYSSGYSHYITNIHIEAAYTGGLASNSSPVVCTTTNLPGSPSYYLGAALSTGTVQVMDMKFPDPIQSVNVSSNTVVTCPATSLVRWNVILGYFVAP